jgi:hypothetical protein
MSEALKDGTMVLLEWAGGGAYDVGVWDGEQWGIEGFGDNLSDSDFNCFALINKPEVGK